MSKKSIPINRFIISSGSHPSKNHEKNKNPGQDDKELNGIR
jgi:hypothetical protein